MCLGSAILIFRWFFDSQGGSNMTKAQFKSEISIYWTLLHNCRTQLGRPTIQGLLMLEILTDYMRLTLLGWFVAGSLGKTRKKHNVNSITTTTQYKQHTNTKHQHC